MKYKVSVIVPVYNTEKFIRQCADSLLAQTLDAIEIIFVNDCSPDNSLSILREYETDYGDRIKVIDSPVNLRQGGARNLGMQAASGVYIGFVDSDDAVAPDMYEKLYAVATLHDADAVFGQYACFPESENYTDYLGASPDVIWDASVLNKYNNRALSVQDKNDLMCFLQTSVWCGIYKKDILTENNLFFPEHLRYEDNYWVTLTKPYLNKVVYLPETVYFYRKNSGSTVNAFNQAYQFDRITVEVMLLDEMQKRGLYEDYKSALEYIFTFRATFNTIYTLSLKFSKTPKKEIKQLLADLKRRFPKWQKNAYYKTLPRRKKFTNAMIYRFPHLYTATVPLVRKIKKHGKETE